MSHWYSAEHGGFESLTGIAYEELTCGNCHVSAANCSDCHTQEDPGEAVVSQETCLSCHGRQQVEQMAHIPDVHRDAGMTCMDCHSSDEIHGDGRHYDSFLETESPRCESCHRAMSPGAHHSIHGDALSCAACHVSAAVTCYNCHFQATVDEKRKLAYAKFRDWTFLGNFRDQVYPMNFQSVEYRDKTFVAYGPFYGHTISEQGKTCSVCHASDAVREYEETGRIEVVRWDAALQKLVPRTGTIPIPPDYEKALGFDFVTRDENDGWIFLKGEVDKSQMLYGTPLSSEQMERLRDPH